MYKLKIINYQPYEYELLQETLNQLGLQGYQCQDLSFLSIFKKVNHPVYYHIDFFQTSGESQFEKRANKDRFVERYLAHDYYPIYKKKGMYVFTGKEKSKKLTTNQDVYLDIVKRQRIHSFFFACLSLILTFFFSMFLMESYTIDSFLTYGITIATIGVFIALIAIIYRFYHHFYNYGQIIHQKKQSVVKLKKHLLIFKILSTISLVCIIGGLIEDVMNIKTVTLEEHPLILMKDIGINKESELTYQSRSSFTVPHCYSSLESIDDNTMLLTKEYQLSSSTKAQKLFQELSKDPKRYLCTKVDIQDHVIYGYQKDILNTLVIQKEKSVIMLTMTFQPSSKQIQQIVDFYL